MFFFFLLVPFFFGKRVLVCGSSVNIYCMRKLIQFAVMNYFKKIHILWCCKFCYPLMLIMDTSVFFSPSEVFVGNAVLENVD